MVLGLSETHSVLLLIAILVGEYDHEVSTGEILSEFVGQAVERILIADGAFTGGDNDEQAVGRNIGSKLRQLVPVSHRLILATHARMLVDNEFLNQVERLLSAVKQDAALQQIGETADALQPAMNASSSEGVFSFKDSLYSFNASGIVDIAHDAKERL